MNSTVYPATPYLGAAPPKTGEISTDRQYLGHEFFFWPSLLGVITQWTVEDIRGAINQHDFGWFTMSASLAVVASRFPTIYGPLEQRLGIPLGIEREISGGDRGPARRAKEDFAMYMKTMESEFEDIFLPHCMMGVAWLHTHWGEQEGDLVPSTKVWPSVATRFLEPWGRSQALTSEGWIDMTDGDGKWTKIGSGERPHRLGAIRALGEQWGKAAYCERDEAGLSAFLGRLAPFAILPEGKAGANGAAGTAMITPMSREGKEIADALKMLGRARGGGLFPAGTKIDSLKGIDAGTAALFTDLAARSKSSFGIAVLGTDGTVSPGAGGVYVSPVFGRVAMTTIRRDVRHGERGFNQIARVGTTLNYGPGVQAPEYKWLLPDPSEAERRDALAKAYASFNATIAGWKAAGFAFTDDDVQSLARDLGVKAPKLGAAIPPVQQSGAKTA